MMVSTKGRYALRVMIDLAEHAQDGGDAAIPLGQIARRQEISQKYLESIAAMLSRGGLIVSTRGKDGGYRLARPVNAITAGEILRLTEGSLAPVACVENGCARAEICRTLPLWRQLDGVIDGYLDRITLDDVMHGRVEPK